MTCLCGFISLDNFLLKICFHYSHKTIPVGHAGGGTHIRNILVLLFDCTRFTICFTPSLELFLFISHTPQQKTIKSFFVRRDVSAVIEEIWVAIFTPGSTKPHTLYFPPRLFFSLLDRPTSMAITKYHQI